MDEARPENLDSWERALERLASAQPVKLHLGCGSRMLSGFIHVDITPYPHVDCVSDVSRLDFVGSETVDLVYASHVLEHFGRYEYQRALAEWHRVLKQSGTLRVAVPDFAACARLYEQGQVDALDSLIGLICGGQRDQYDYHKMVFDEDLLTRKLLEAGFCDVRQWDWRETEHCDVDDYSQAYLPHLDKENGVLVSLNLECTKSIFSIK